MTFQCTTCGEQKPTASFYRSAKYRRGHFSECKKCWGDRVKKWRLANPEKMKVKRLAWLEKNKQIQAKLTRKSALKIRYGLTEADFLEIFDRQGGVCKICERPSNLVVDHCHKTGRVRMLLCNKCNRGLGCFDDDPKLLARAAEVIGALMDVLPEVE